MGYVEVLKKRAKESIKTIVLPETEDMRTIEAADKILKEGIAKIILIGNEEAINKKAAEGGFDISGALSLIRKHLTRLRHTLTSLLN